MEQMILVFYINVDGITRQQAEQGLYHLSKTKHPEGSIQYFLPVKNQPTKVECINPKMVTEEQYETMKKELEEIKYFMSLPDEMRERKMKLDTI